ncbi:MAG: precorrin-6y C5,15-methyltransferase (decarboxylating) subunit CbiE [Pseudomonadota bacterium]
MSKLPWLTIIGIGEDGVEGLSASSQAALTAAEIIMGPSRHLSMLTDGSARRITWPVPFSEGLPILQDLRGQRVVVLASGDPFWFGAGSVIARAFDAQEWLALPGPSCFSLVAARMGWPLEQTACLGLHAAPMARLKRHLAPGTRMIATLRDGDAVAELLEYLAAQGFEDSLVTIWERLGGPLERRVQGRANALEGDFAHPVCAAVEVSGIGTVLSVATGLPDNTFESDGQMTKRLARAITLSSLGPLPGQHLWDIGGGSGSISLEWLLAHPTTRASAIEPRPDRADRIIQNAEVLGVEDRIKVIEGIAPDCLQGLAAPDAIFVGGGMSGALMEAVTAIAGIRVVANAVTLEGEMLLSQWHDRLGGDLLRIALSSPVPLGSKRGWGAAYPVVQWSIVT